MLKPDIRGSTIRFRALPEADLAVLRREHRAFVSRLAAAHDGRLVKPEGDGVWVVFPSVSAGALAAMPMQEELRRAQPGKGDERRAMRIGLTLGDVLHQEGALVGDAVVLAARIEESTPPDELYLSPAAWLAGNQAEGHTSFVDAVVLKGFPEPVPVYRLTQTHRMRVIADPYSVFTDLRGLSTIPMSTVEKLLDRLRELVGRGGRECGGTNRFGTGDASCLTCPEPGRALAAVERLAEGWGAFEPRERLRCPLNVVVHKAVLSAFRSYLLSSDLNVAVPIERAMRRRPPGDTSIFVTGQVRLDVVGTPWAERLQPLAVRLTSPQPAAIESYRLRCDRCAKSSSCTPGSRLNAPR
jgi:class 3 adenylate cyclase